MDDRTYKVPPWRIVGTIFGAAVMIGVAGCSGTTKDADQPDSGTEQAEASDGAKIDDEQDAAGEQPLPLGPITKSSFREHPARVAWVFDPGAEEPRKMSIGQAEARGYTIVDLGNDWTPYIFSEKTPGLDDAQKNRYREVYVGLANDQVNRFGDELRDYERNYLELYGIPPSLQVVWREWQEIETEIAPCLEEAGFDSTVFENFNETIVYSGSSEDKRNRQARWFKAKLDKAMRRARLDPGKPEDLEAAASHPKTKRMYANWREHQAAIDVIDHAQRRFRCEGLFNADGGRGRFTPGVFDSETTHALADFEKKHDIMGWGHFKTNDFEMLAKPLDVAVHERLLRVLEERVVTSAGILEDGSAASWRRKFKWKDADGNEHELRDLASEFTAAAAEALGLTDPQSSKERLAMLSDLGDGDFQNLLIAVKMPPLPEYYGENMKLSAIIDRGDVWYDFPYDEFGERKSQPRRRYPHLTLYVDYLDQKIPLVHWRTTIGSWRKEFSEEDGTVLMKYKNSDVGDRVWKDIVAAPTWIPPVTTPPGALIKGQYYRGRFRKDVNYDEIGPGYMSAYGLVAAYHIKQRFDEEGNLVGEYDNSIRTHGSVDYMSILRRFSHGCHRLYNMNAVRLFSFVLRHRDYVRHGQQPVGVSRDIEFEEEMYRMRITTRGYKYELVEPIPVTVTKGRIRGRLKRPIDEYMEIPVPPEENAIEVDDGEGGILTLPIPLPPMPATE